MGNFITIVNSTTKEETIIYDVAQFSNFLSCNYLLHVLQFIEYEYKTVGNKMNIVFLFKMFDKKKPKNCMYEVRLIAVYN